MTPCWAGLVGSPAACQHIRGVSTYITHLRRVCLGWHIHNMAGHCLSSPGEPDTPNTHACGRAEPAAAGSCPNDADAAACGLASGSSRKGCSAKWSKCCDQSWCTPGRRTQIPLKYPGPFNIIKHQPLFRLMQVLRVTATAAAVTKGSTWPGGGGAGASTHAAIDFTTHQSSSRHRISLGRGAGKSPAGGRSQGMA